MKLLIAAAALFVAVLSANAAVAGAQYISPGTIVVTPPTPAPGDPVTVTVTDCEPAPGVVNVLIDGVFVGQAPVASDGSFVADFLVPLEAEGEVLVQVLCTAEVLASVVDVRIPGLPFLDPGVGALPRTGANSTVPLAQAGAALLGVGAMLVLLVARRREPESRHAAGVHA